MARPESSGKAQDNEPLRLRFATFELDEADARLTRDGKPIPLAPRPFAVLCALARTPRTLVTKDALLDAVWGHRFVSDSVLKTTVSALRAALDDDAREPQYIETVSRRGYRFIGAVSGAGARVGSTTPMLTDTFEVAPSPASIIGRYEPIERLRAAWQLARAGKRRIVWIAGEPGVGKTTLIEHFMQEAGDACCAHGQCVGQAGEPYLPALEAISALCRRDASLPELIRAVAPTWLLQLPWLSSASEREALRRDVGGSGQTRMLREFGELLERYTEDRPLLLVTEDLHWTDPATLQLIDHTARRRGAARLLWLASFRLTEVMAADHPLKTLRHELRLHGLSEEIVLDAFSEAEVADYIAARLPGFAGDESFVRGLHARTEGLPLFVADVVSDLASHGDPAPNSESSAGSRLQSMAIPENLAGIIEQYIKRLTPDERVLLEAASACGAEFRLNTMAEVLESDIAPVARTCAELVREQRWLIDVPLELADSTSDTRYAFRHALYREVLHKRIGPVARAELHRKVAAALECERAEGVDVMPAELALHFELAHELMPALRYYAEAAESALLRFSPAQTMSLAEHALAFLPHAQSGVERTTLEITLATLQGAAAIHLLGISADDVKHAFQHAVSLLDQAPQHPLRGLFLSGLELGLYMRVEPDEADALAQRCESLALAGDRTALLCACLAHGLVQHLRGRPRFARVWLEKGLAAHEGLDDTTCPAVFAADPKVIVLGFLAIALLHVGLIDHGRARILQAYERARALHEPGPQMAALWFDALFEVRMENPERVAKVSERLRALAEEYELPEGRAANLFFGGWAKARLGDARAGHRLIREGYGEALRLGIRAWGSETLAYAVEALTCAGEWLAARQELEEAMQYAQAIGERHCLPQLLLLDARIADALGEPARAHDALRRAVAEARTQEAPWPEMIALTALSERGDAASRDRESLRRVLENIEGGADAGPVVRARAALAPF